MSAERNSHSLRSHGNVSYGGMCEDDEEEKGEDAVVNIGEEYQAAIPPLETENYKSASKELKLWVPTSRVTDDDLEAYVYNANNVSNLTEEQLLGLLYWHNYSVTEASNSVQMFNSKLTEWSDQDRELFGIAYQKFGKEFGHIKKYMLRDKSRSSIVEYYYSWKNSQLKKSFFDQQLRLEAQLDAKDDDGKQKELCVECGIECEGMSKSETKDLKMCKVCQKCFEKTGVILSSRRPIVFGQEKATLLTDAMEEMCDPILLDDKTTMKLLETKIVNHRKLVQKNKQLISSSKELMESKMVKFKKTKKIKIFSRWSERDQKLAQLAIEEYKMNSKDLSEILRTKSEAQVQTFMDLYYKD